MYKGVGVGVGGLSSAFCSSMCYSCPGRSTRKAETGWWRGMRSDILPRSPAQSTVLFSSGRGGGRGREDSINDHPLTPYWTFVISIFYFFIFIFCGPLSAIVQWKNRTNIYELPNMMQIWEMSRQEANCFSVMRLAKWNNPELQQDNSFSTHVISMHLLHLWQILLFAIFLKNF